ncbi:hypothetical protein KR074_006236 [Drosophila pseudoananassae]|nr:hypothetical protein KR074_006236 [Drosophila pseudoananassae]
MFRALLRPSMKRQARGPVSDEQKTQPPQDKSEVQAQKQDQMQIPDENQTKDQKVDANHNQSANSNPTMSQSQVKLLTQLPVASTSSNTAALLLDDALEDQEKNNETATNKHTEFTVKEPEQDSVESGAQGDNEQSDSELPGSSNCHSPTPHPLPLPKSRSISISNTISIPLPLSLPRPLHNRQDLPDEGGNPEQMKSIAGREQIAKLLLICLGEGAGAEGDGEANQIVMELLGGRDSSSHSSNSSDTTSDSSGTGIQSSNDGNINDKSSNDSAIPDPATMPSPSAIERVSEQLMSVLREQTLNDAGISIGNERYHCFKCVLQNYAKIYAARRFMEQLPQLEPQENAQGQDQSSGEQSQSAQGQSNGVEADQKLLARVVADEIPELLRQLWSSLEKMEFFNEDTAFKAYLEARNHPEARILRELMLTRISRVYLCIVSSSFFLDFTEHELTHILRNCYLSVNSEIEIFLSVVLWLEHNWYERRECAERILAQVRFGLMPTWYLATLDRANRCRHFSRVIQSPGVQRMIAQGLEDGVTLKRKRRSSGTSEGGAATSSTGKQTQPQRQSEPAQSQQRLPHLSQPRRPQEPQSQQQQSQPRQLAQQQRTTDPPLPREWIADPECRHHHKCHCERFVYPTYDVFKEYLARIICCAPNYWRNFRPAQEVYRSDFRCCSPPHFN